MRKLYFLVALLLIFTVALTGCGQKDTPLRLGTEATFKPFEFTNEANEVIGFDIDIAKEIANKLNRKLEISNMDFDGLIGALQGNQIDMAVAGMTITKDREESVDFSTPYYDASQVIVVREEETAIASQADLPGKIIAVQMGTTGASEAEKVQDAQLKQFGKVNEAFLELKNGRADAVIIDAPVAKEYLKVMEGLKIASEPFTNEQYGIAVKKGNSELLTKIDEALQELKDSGKYQEIYDKWFSSVETSTD